MKRGASPLCDKSIQPRKKRATAQREKVFFNFEIMRMIEKYDGTGESAFESLWDDIGHLLTLDNLLRVEDGTTLLYDIVFSYFNGDPAASAFSITLFFDKYKADPAFLHGLTQTQTENEESAIHIAFMAAYYMDSSVFADDIEKIWQQFKTKQQFILALMERSASNHTPLYFLMENMPALFCEIFQVCKSQPGFSDILSLRAGIEYENSLSILSWVLHEDPYQPIRQEVWDLCKDVNGKLKLSWLEITASHIDDHQLIDSLLQIAATLCEAGECQYFEDIYQQFNSAESFLDDLVCVDKPSRQYCIEIDRLRNLSVSKAPAYSTSMLVKSDRLLVTPLLRIAAANNTEAFAIFRQFVMQFRENPVFVRALLNPCKAQQIKGVSAMGVLLRSDFVNQIESYFLALCKSLIRVVKTQNIDAPLEHVLSFYQERQYKKALNTEDKFKSKYHLMKAYSSACESNNLALIRQIAIVYLNQNKNTHYENQIEDDILCEKTQPVTFFRTLKLERKRIQLDKENQMLRAQLAEQKSPTKRPMSESAKNMYA